MSASVTLENLSVEFPIAGVNRRLLAGLKKSVGGVISMNSGAGGPSTKVTALKSVNLQLRSGDRVGLVGHNGAGKSTLLKVVAGVYPASSGRVTTTGAIASILQSGLGLEQDKTGYENIFIAGLIHGCPRREMRKKLDDIIGFSELGDYMHLPLRTYSSGMRTRLAFAVATSIRPQILIMDEGIGAGDQRFASKAMARMKDLIDSVEILLVASHSHNVLQRYCNKGILMWEGQVAASGPLADIEQVYEEKVSGLADSLTSR